MSKKQSIRESYLNLASADHNELDNIMAHTVVGAGTTKYGTKVGNGPAITKGGRKEELSSPWRTQ